jgi:protease I
MKAVFLVPQIGFNDHELFILKKTLEKNKIDCIVSSYSKGEVISKNGKIIKAHEIICNLKAKDYDCFIFVGGENVSSLTEHKCVIELLKAVNAQNKLIVLLCMHPALFLPRLNFLEGKKMTVFKSKNKWSVETIKNNAIYVDEPVVVDGNIITCRDEKDTKELADKIVNLMKS